MKTARCILVSLLLVATMVGCSSVASRAKGEAALLQQVLDAILPPTFTGDLRVSHKNAYFRITIHAGELKRTAAGWTWSWLAYVRDGYISTGSATFGTPPAVLQIP